MDHGERVMMDVSARVKTTICKEMSVMGNLDCIVSKIIGRLVHVGVDQWTWLTVYSICGS